MKIANRKAKITVGVILTVFLGYIVGEGLAYRLWRTDKIPYDTYHKLYSPIIWLGHHSALADDIFTRYEQLWFSDYKNFKRYLDEVTNTNQPTQLNK